MDQQINDTDENIMTRLREPIKELVDKYYLNEPDEVKLKLRQLAWQALDILIKTSNVSLLRHEKNILTIIRDIKEIGAPEKFIKESLQTAFSIYKKMQTSYPHLLLRYKG